MWKLIRFDSEAKAEIERVGLSWLAISDIFLFKRIVRIPFSTISGCPRVNAAYQAREYQAAEWSYNTIEEGCFSITDPLNGATKRLGQSYALQPPDKFYFIPLFYRFLLDNEQFWVAVAGHTGRITIAFSLERRACIYEIDSVMANNLLTLFEESELIGSEVSSYLGCGTQVGVRGIVDMVTNYGHQMINHLSGIERLQLSVAAEKIHEISVCGKSFFGDLRRLFPSISHKIRYFSQRADMVEEINRSPALTVRLGSNYFPGSLRKRIIASALDCAAYPVHEGRYPKIVITVRTQGRICNNLPTIIGSLYRELCNQFKKLGIILDGWVIPESERELVSSIATAIKESNIGIVRQELLAARSIIQALPDGAVVRNLIGESMNASIAGLLSANSYFAHVGTLQHKIGMFNGVPGVIHGPRAQLTNIDSGPYQAEIGSAPFYISPGDVVDELGNMSDRGTGFNNYKINSLERAIEFISTTLARERE